MMNIMLNDSSEGCKHYNPDGTCGFCKDNYSLTLYNLTCGMCDNNNLSFLLLFAFAGIALIALLLVLQMTVAKGVINGLIFYTNIFSIYSYFVLDDKKDVNLYFQVFIAWANLDFGIPMCFSSGLDHYTYTWLQFLFPMYLWFLIALIIIGCQLSSRFGTLFGSNPTAVLATVILMSFSKLVQTSQQALAWDTINNTEKFRWRMDTSKKYFDKGHIYLFIAAVLTVFLLLVPYILLLLLGYKIQKYSSRKGFRWFNYLKPILDAYYAPYNKNSRFWVGFLLLVRSSLFLSLCFLKEEYISVTMSVVIVAVLAVAWLNSRIYENYYVEVLEATFILNISILGIASNFIEIYKYTHYHDFDKDTHYHYYVNNVSVGIVFVEFIGIILFHILLCIKKLFSKDSKSLCSKKWMNFLKTNKNTKHEDNKNAVTNTVMMVPLREPLLDDPEQV